MEMNTNQMIQNVIVIAVSTYIIKNEKTGEVENSGTTVRYLATDDLSPCEDTQRSAKGYKPAKANLPIGDFSKLPVVPALYNTAFSVSIDGQGKATLKADSFKYCGDISLSVEELI
jgi:hypothetical protein